MKILFDQGTTAPLRRWFVGDEVATANEMGWSDLSNGRLLEAAEGSAFQMLVTTDQNLKHEQNLTGRVIAILVLPTTSWPKIRRHAGFVVEVAGTLTAGARLKRR
jgi:hypothetical protein